MMHILIDARFKDGGPGGIQQVVMGIAYGFSKLDNCGNFRFTFLMLEGHGGWLKDLLPEKSEIKYVPCNKPTFKHGALNSFKNWGKRKFGHLFGESSINVPEEPEIVAQINPDIIHFVHQNIFHTERPFIFMPMDLQHEYYPEYFSKRTVMVRRVLYRRHSERAAAVICISKACKQDVVKYLSVPEEKCSVIYCAPATDVLSEAKDHKEIDIERLSLLPDKYLFYPARFYAHKNHLNLIRAVKLAKLNGKTINVVCSGAETPFYRQEVVSELKRAGVQEQFSFMGWVTSGELRFLYKNASGLVFPSFFEGFGMPLVEAMRAGLPIASSDRSCIPEIVGAAGIYFDPGSPKEIANSMIQILEDSGLKSRLLTQAALQVEKFSWISSAKELKKVYKTVFEE